MRPQDLEWLSRLPKRENQKPPRSQNEGEETKLDPELLKKLKEREIRKAVDPDFALEDAKVREAIAKAELQTRRMEKALEENREPESLEEPKLKIDEEKKERRFSVLNGQVFLDPEGDYTLNEALKIAATQQGSRTTKGYIGKPDGTTQEVDGVVARGRAIHAPHLHSRPCPQRRPAHP